MNHLESRIKKLEEKAGIDMETRFIVVRWIPGRQDCKALTEDNEDLCPAYQKFKLNPGVTNGIALFWSPCEDCKEPVKK